MEFTAVPSVSPAAPERAARRKGTQAVLEVRGKTRLSPRLLRVTLGGEQYSELRRNHHTDAYVKLLIASEEDRKSTRLNSSHVAISYAVFCLKKKKTKTSIPSTRHR